MRTKLHFDILDFSLAVFFFVILASGGLSISDTYTAPNTQVALISGSLAQADYYQGYSEGNYGGTQTQTYGAYGNTGSPTGNTGSPAGNTSDQLYGNTGSPASNAGNIASSGTRYGTAADCKQNVQAKGTFLYPVGVDEKTLDIIVDPEFNAKMKKERFTPDLPVTPIYDLVVEAVPTFTTCYTDKPEKLSTEPPKTLPFPVSIKLGSETLVGPGVLVQGNRKNDDSKLLYEWKISGWKYGIAKDEKLEKIIKAIQEQKSVKISVDTTKQSDGRIGKEEAEASFDLCAPLWGSGEHKVVFERGKSAAFSLQTFIDKTEESRTEGFEVIEPFKKYSKPGVDRHSSGYFSHIADLANLDDQLIRLLGKDKSEHFSSAQVVDMVTKSSSCSPILITHSYGDGGGDPNNYILRANLGGITVNSGYGISGIASFNNASIVDPSADVDTVVHEFVHQFAQLWDEDGGSSGFLWPLPDSGFNKISRNCSLNPSSDWTRYGDVPSVATEGCLHRTIFFDPFEKGIKVGDKNTIIKVHRPSSTGLMTYSRDDEAFMDDQLSVVDCGFVVAKIKGGSAAEYWPECMGLDGVIKPTKIASIPPPTVLASIFSKNSSTFFNQNLTASVIDAVPLSKNNFLIFERLEPPAGGVMWEDGQPMPSSLKIGLATSSGSSTPTMSQTDSYQGDTVSSVQTAAEGPTVETAIPTQPKPGLWQRFLNYFTGGESATKQDSVPMPPVPETSLTQGRATDPTEEVFSGGGNKKVKSVPAVSTQNSIQRKSLTVSPCYVYDSNFASYAKNYGYPYDLAKTELTLKTSTGQTKSIFILNQNPPSVLQPMYLRATQLTHPCVPTFNKGAFSSPKFVTKSGLLPLYYSEPSDAQIFPYDSKSAFVSLDSFYYDGFYNLDYNIPPQEAIIDSVAQNKKLDIQITGDKNKVTATLSVPVTNCVQLTGATGPKKIVFMRGASWSSNVDDFLWYADLTQKNLTAPDGLYALQAKAKLLSFSVDLKKTNDSQIHPSDGVGGVNTTNLTSTELALRSACGFDAYSYILLSRNNYDNPAPTYTYSNPGGTIYAFIYQAPLVTPVLTVKKISNTNIALTWTTTSLPADIDGFKVVRRLGYNGTWSEIGTTAKTVMKYTDAKPVKGNLNYYGVYAYKGTNKSKVSGDYPGSYVDITPPSVPSLSLSTYFTKYTINGVVSCMPRIRIEWQDSTDDHDNYSDKTFKAAGYNLYRFAQKKPKLKIGSFTRGGEFGVASGPVFHNEHHDTAKDALKVGNEYCYVASAYDWNTDSVIQNTSTQSAEQCITIPKPNIANDCR